MRIYSNFGIKNTIYKNVKVLKMKNIKNKIKLTPEIKIRANQVKKIKIVWPKSGCEINSNIIGNKTRKLNKYFKYRLVFFSKVKIEAMITIIKGFNTSMGWNLGKNNKSIHLLDPFTSTPINGTSNKATKQITKRKFESLNRFFKFKYERTKTTVCCSCYK